MRPHATVKLQFSPLFRKQLKKLKRKNSKTFHKVFKLLAIFRKNPYNPKLKTHSLKGKLKSHFTFSIDNNFRVTFLWKNKTTIMIVSVGTHDQVYR